MTWRIFANYLLITLFEPPCAACKKTLSAPLDGAVCEACWRHLRLAPRIVEHHSSDRPILWSCAVDHYEGRMKEIVHALKYERRRSIAPRLGALMRDCGSPLLRGADAVVPVPLHPRREYERGFNQAEDLAMHLGVPMMRLLTRVKHTQSQIELPKERRQQNVKGAFGLERSAIDNIPQIVVLVDDVSTTGSTLEACAHVLKDAGVREVRALTAARVVNARH